MRNFLTNSPTTLLKTKQKLVNASEFIYFQIIESKFVRLVIGQINLLFSFHVHPSIDLKKNFHSIYFHSIYVKLLGPIPESLGNISEDKFLNQKLPS